MQLPIDIPIEGDTIWTEYSLERNKIRTFKDLKVFIERWKNLYVRENLKEHMLDDTIIVSVINQIADSLQAAEIILPFRILKAMMQAKQYIVSLNTAFIQGNGGIGEFE